MVDGEVTFTLGETTQAAPPGSVLVVPTGVLQAFRNVGTRPGHLIAMIWPATDFEGFVAAAGTPEPPTGPPDLEALLAAATAHGIVVPPPSAP